jgi:hypothetical protein
LLRTTICSRLRGIDTSSRRIDFRLSPAIAGGPQTTVVDIDLIRSLRARSYRQSILRGPGWVHRAGRIADAIAISVDVIAR